MLIAIGENHHGYQVREMLIEAIGQAGHEVIDLGVCDDRPVDYPDIAAAVARKVGRKEVDRGILISGSGLGVLHRRQQISRRSRRSLPRRHDGGDESAP